jgi:hypothetical protein
MPFDFFKIWPRKSSRDAKLTQIISSHFQKDLEVNGQLKLLWILEREDGELRTGMIELRLGTGVGSCEQSKEPPGSANCYEILEFL